MGWTDVTALLVDKGDLGQQAQTLQPTKIRAELERMLLCSDHTQIAGSR